MVCALDNGDGGGKEQQCSVSSQDEYIFFSMDFFGGEDDKTKPPQLY